MLSLVLALATLDARAACDSVYPEPVWRSDLDDLAIADVRLVSYTTHGSMFTARFRAVAESTEGATFADVVATLEEPPVGQLRDGEVRFSAVVPGTETESDDTFTIRAALSEKAAVRAWLLSAPWTVSGWEAPTMSDGTRFVDADTDAAFLRWGQDDGLRTVAWFAGTTDLLDALQVGDVLLPMPDQEHWPGVEPFVGMNLPGPDQDDCYYFPFLVHAILEGDGTNGGDPGEIGVVRSLDETAWGDQISSAMVVGSWVSPDPYTVGPFDTMSSALAELGQENRACPVGVDAYDTDGDGEGDACPFTGSALRFDLELASGVNLAGHIGLTNVRGDVSMRVRLGEPTRMEMSLEATLQSALTLHAESEADLARTEETLLAMDVPLFQVPAGPFDIAAGIHWDLYAGYEGQVHAASSFGMMRSDRFVLSAVWTAGDGLVVDADHVPVTWPITDPRLSTDAMASFTGFVGTDLGLFLEEQVTQSGVSASIAAEFDATLGVEPLARPWWTLEAGYDLSLMGDAWLLGGLESWEAPLAQLTELSVPVGEAPGGSTGTAGDDARWGRTLDCNVGTKSDSALGDVFEAGDGGLVITGSSGLHTCLVKTDAQGEVEWAKHADYMGGYRSLAPLDDGGFVLAADSCEWLARFDVDGNVVWKRRVSMPGGFMLGLCEAQPFTDGDGVEGVALVGTSQVANLRYPTVGFVDLDGEVGWWRTYTVGGHTGTAVGAEVTSAGELAVVGTTNAPAHDLGGGDGWGSSNGGGLVMMIDPWGDPIWATSLSASDLRDVTEATDGRLLVVGNAGTYYYQPRHGILMASLEPVEGALQWSTTYAEDVAFEGRVDDPYSHVPGDTAWDEGMDIAALGDGTVALIGESSLGDDQAVWVARLTEGGMPLWSWMHDGPDNDETDAVIRVADGILVAGTTASLPNDDDDGRQMHLMRLPEDGGLWHAAEHGFVERSLQVEINDTRDESHVLWHHEGGNRYGVTTTDFAASTSSVSTNVHEATAASVRVTD